MSLNKSVLVCDGCGKSVGALTNGLCRSCIPGRESLAPHGVAVSTTRRSELFVIERSGQYWVGVDGKWTGDPGGAILFQRRPSGELPAGSRLMPVLVVDRFVRTVYPR